MGVEKLGPHLDLPVEFGVSRSGVNYGASANLQSGKVFLLFDHPVAIFVKETKPSLEHPHQRLE